MPRRILFLLVAIGVLLLVGLGLWISQREPSDDVAPSSQLQVKSITLGTVKSAAEGSRPDARIRAASEYETDDVLALRVAMTGQLTGPVVVPVRLLSARSEVVPLTPGSITLTSSTSTHCCWTLTQAGSYSFQLFFPNQAVSAVPITVREAPTKH